MTADLWTDVDNYIGEQLITDDEALFAAVLAANQAAGLPPIDVSPAQGKFLNLLVKMSGSRRILEVGTLGGYSTIWLAKALPEGGEIVTLEFNPHHAATARANFARAGLSDRVRLIEGAAADTMPGVIGPFDFIFIDADKPSNVIYLQHALRLAAPGAVIIVDNVVRNGRVADPAAEEPNVKGSRAAFAFLASHPRVESTALQTVGAKGWDGFILARVSA